MSIEFRAVSVERAVEIMRVWASRRWPLSVEEGVSAYTGLGFHSSPDDRTLFTSDMSPTRADSYFVVEGMADIKQDCIRELCQAGVAGSVV